MRSKTAFKRFYDPENTCTKGVLKEYKHWILEVSYRQHTFGCYIIFCKREGVEKISALTDKEIAELKRVCREIEKALLQNRIFKPERFNYWQMGNGLHQLHFHGIPRYPTAKKLGHKVFIDKSFGTVPTWTRKKQTDETVIELKNAMRKYLT